MHGIVHAWGQAAEKRLPFQVRQQGRSKAATGSFTAKLLACTDGAPPGPQYIGDDHAAEHAFIAHRAEINLGAIATLAHGS